MFERASEPGGGSEGEGEGQEEGEEGELALPSPPFSRC